MTVGLFALCVAVLFGLASGAVTNFDNCELLGTNLKVAWTVDRDAGKVNFLLCGCLLPEQRDAGSNQYMGFGLSGSPNSVNMMNADAVIAWIDQSIQPHAEDYYLSGRYQCRGGDGVCPDELYAAADCSNDVTEIEGYVEDGMQCVSFSRPIEAADGVCDRSFDLNGEQYIVWAVGGIEETAFKHFVRAEYNEAPIVWTRNPVQNCDQGLQCSGCPAFENEQMVAMDNTTFVANIGPTGNERGYISITGRAGWGIAWYLNGTLIPELVVQRGSTYTFISEGGNNPEMTGTYHPFYITDSRSGGRRLNTPAQQEAEQVFAGFTENDVEIGVGPYCEYNEVQASRDILMVCGSREQYIQSLVYSCPNGDDDRGTFTWTPDETTPNTVYYQCATHRNLGWKITVMGDAAPLAPSLPVITALLAITGVWMYKL